MKILGEKTIKAVVIGIVGMIAIFAFQRVAVSLIAKKIPAKSGGTAIYMVYGSGSDTYYAVKVDGAVAALFKDKNEAEQFAKKAGGSVEVFPGR